jgi:hypothetical protein
MAFREGGPIIEVEASTALQRRSFTLEDGRFV